MSRTAVSRIILGTMEMGRRMNLEESTEFLRKFHEYGHNQLDSAYMYASEGGGGSTGGLTEKYLGQMEHVEGCNVATKANPGGGKTLSPESVRHQLETSLQNLNAECLDIFYPHWPCMDVDIEDTLH